MFIENLLYIESENEVETKKDNSKTKEKTLTRQNPQGSSTQKVKSRPSDKQKATLVAYGKSEYNLF